MLVKDAIALAREWASAWASHAEPLLVSLLAKALERDAVRKHPESGFILQLLEPFASRGVRITRLRVHYPDWKSWQIARINRAAKAGEKAQTRCGLALMNGFAPAAGDLIGEDDLAIAAILATFVLNIGRGQWQV